MLDWSFYVLLDRRLETPTVLGDAVPVMSKGNAHTCLMAVPTTQRRKTRIHMRNFVGIE